MGLRACAAPRTAASQTGLADAGVVDTCKQYCFVIKWINFAARPHPEMTRKRRVVKKPARASARRQSKQG